MHAEAAERMLITQLAERLATSGHGQRGALVSQAAERLGCSPQSIYNRLRGIGMHSNRKLRSDKGDSKVTRDEVFMVAAIMASSRRANDKLLLATQDAIDIALANGKLSVPVSSERILRLMRLYGCHPTQVAQADPHVTMRSLHPNHVWQLDASICVLYRLRNGRAGVMDQRKFNARKPRDLAKIMNERVLRYAVTDHTSGALYAKYYLAAGEDQFTLFEFLMDAFHAREDGQMFGAPWMMVWDAGSANQAHAIGNLLDGLAIDHWAHLPGNPRAKGQVEGVHNIIERKFEGRLSMVTIDTLEQLNAHLDTWLTKFNGQDIHSRHGHTRWGQWQTIRTEQLRICPSSDVCRDLMFAKPLRRKVTGNLVISYTCKGYEPAQYSIAHIPGVRVGEEVVVTVNPYHLPHVFVIAEDAEGKKRYHECTPIAKDLSGFAIDSPVFGESYRAPRDTDVDTARKEVNDLAYGERETLKAKDAKYKGRVAFNGEIDPFKDVREKAAQTPRFMQRKGTALDVPLPTQIELRPLTHVEALMELHARLNRALAPSEAAQVRAWYPDGIPDAELDALQARLENGPDTQSFPEARPRLVAIK